MISYAEFAVTSNFSFLRAGSHPEEYVGRAHELGYAAIGLADRNTLAGVVRAHGMAKELGLRFAVGCRLVFADATPDILAYPTDRAAYGRLCRLLTTGNLREEAAKGECLLRLADLLEWAEGLCLVLLPPDRIDEAFASIAGRLAEATPGHVWLGASVRYRGDDGRRLARIAELGRRLALPVMAVGDVLYHAPERRPLQDVVTCIREHVTLDSAGRRLEANAERHLKAPREMARLFRAAPEAIAETVAFLSRLHFSLDDLRYEYPHETRDSFATPQDALVALAWKGAGERYPQGISDKVRRLLDHELGIIGELEYAPYFLTVHDIVRFAREKGILCQGRGSAANSAVCYCLRLTEVDPERTDLLFERFISKNRGEAPDIDIDFEHERRGEVLQYVYDRYGRDRAGLAATTITYRTRSAVREVGKAFGLSEDTVGALAGMVWGWSSDGVNEAHVRRLGLDPAEPRLARALALSRELIAFPRHLSQHVGGMVITEGRLDELVPITKSAMDERPIVEWNKDDLDELGLLKVDILALGMLTALRKGFALLRQHYGKDWRRIPDIPAEDEAVYRMLQRADSVGVFQVESRAQQSMLPRLKPSKFEDLVTEVAIVRPGPIQGGMIHPFLRRKQGLEPATYPSRELEQVLRPTLGVPLFQEQAMQIAMIAAGFTAAEADQLRRAMATFRRVGTIGTFHKKLLDGMQAKGYPRDFAESLWKQIEGFGSYGFPRSHAESFAILVYCSAWIKCHYPDVFAAGLLNSWPMGFYAPAQLIRDAQEHGVEVRPVDILHSDWDHALEPGPKAGERLHSRHADMAGDVWSTHAIRLGLRQVSGLGEAQGRAIVAARREGYDSVRDLWLRTRLSTAVLERLADADAFRSLGLDRRAAFWAIRGLGRAGDKDDLPLFEAARSRKTEPDVALPPMPLGAHVVEDYRHLQLSLKGHPLSFLRARLDRRSVTPNARLAALRSGCRLTVSGLVLVRQRPDTSSGVIFMTIEDEGGWANIIVWPRVFETYRPTVLAARLVAVTGRLQNEHGVIHVVAERFEDLSPFLGELKTCDREMLLPAAEAADLAMPKGRNFH